MKTVTYTRINGKKFTVEYDENAPCIICGEPVGNASMGGTVICPACDCGKNRDGTKWTDEQYKQYCKAAAVPNLHTVRTRRDYLGQSVSLR